MVVLVSISLPDTFKNQILVDANKSQQHLSATIQSESFLKFQSTLVIYIHSPNSHSKFRPPKSLVFHFPAQPPDADLLPYSRPPKSRYLNFDGSGVWTTCVDVVAEMAYDHFHSHYPSGAGYFEGFADSARVPNYDHSSQQHSLDPQDTIPSVRSSGSWIPPHGPLPASNSRTNTVPGRSDVSSQNGVSPELMERITEQITEKVKKELFEHFKQTGNIEEPKPTPMQRAASNKSNSTSSPPPPIRRVYTPPSPAQVPQNHSPPMGPSRSPPASPLDKPSGVRFSNQDPKVNRPSAGLRTYSSLELSTIDKRWGRLFDNEGSPTERLGQILRGLANHLIEEFIPKRSIVIPPTKMAAFYSKHKLEKETQRFTDGEMVDGKPERLPKQISRHLLPLVEDRKSKKLLDRAVSDFFEDIAIANYGRRRQSLTSPPRSRTTSTSQSGRATSQTRVSLNGRATSQTRTRPTETPFKAPSTSQPSKPLERDRMPYVGSPSAIDSAAVDDTIKIERERQPYSAHPGGGKVRTESINIPPIKEISGRNRANSTSRVVREPLVTDPRMKSPPSVAAQAFAQHSARNGPVRQNSPPLTSFSHSTPIDLHSGLSYAPPPSSASSYPQSQTFSSPPSSHTSVTSTFPPPPPPIDIREKKPMEERGHHRRSTVDEGMLAGNFNSPRDAERWDRLQDLGRTPEPDRPDRAFDPRVSIPTDQRDLRNPMGHDSREPTRGPVPLGPRDARNSIPYDEYYRERDRESSRGSGYDDYNCRRY